MDLELLAALKALSDASRLRIVGLLAEGRPVSVEELARRLTLSPGTVVHHLKRLRDVGLVDAKPRRPYMDYSLRLDRLAEIGATLARLAHDAARDHAPVDVPRWAGTEEARVLRTFFEGERLTSIPAQRSKRRVVLRQIVDMDFERKRRYPEKEVNHLLSARFTDTASLRRYLVDERFMARKGGVYRLRPRSDWPKLETGQRSRASVSADTAAAPDP